MEDPGDLLAKDLGTKPFFFCVVKFSGSKQRKTIMSSYDFLKIEYIEENFWNFVGL